MFVLPFRFFKFIFIYLFNFFFKCYQDFSFSYEKCESFSSWLVVIPESKMLGFGLNQERTLWTLGKFFIFFTHCDEYIYLLLKSNIAKITSVLPSASIYYGDKS